MLDIYDIIFVISFVIIVTTLYVLTYNWIIHMEKTGCECANDWRKDFIKIYIYFIIPYNIISVIYLILIGENIVFAFSIKLLLLLLDVFFIVNTIIYITKLKNDKCECSSNIIREVTLIHTIIMGCLLAIAISIFIFVYLSLFISGKINKKYNKIIS